MNSRIQFNSQFFALFEADVYWFFLVLGSISLNEKPLGNVNSCDASRCQSHQKPNVNFFEGNANLQNIMQTFKLFSIHTHTLRFYGLWKIEKKTI